MSHDKIVRDLQAAYRTMPWWFRCECRVCGARIDTAELCADCAKGNNPFFTCDNVGADLGR